MSFTIEKSNLSRLWNRFSGDFSSIALHSHMQTIEENFDERLRQVHKTLPSSVANIRLFAPRTFQSEQRFLEWKHSRFSLIQVVENLLSQGSNPKDILLSVSHTSKYSVAIGYAPQKKDSKVYNSIGVDLESSNRSVSEEANLRFVSENESNQPLCPIEFWVIKEACFKANPRAEETIVANYTVKQFDFKTGKGSVLCLKQKEMDFDFQIVKVDEFIIAFSVSMIKYF